MRLSSPLRAALAAAAILAALAPTASRAALFVPTKAADTDDGVCDDADCSLREAVLAANATVGSDVILLHAGTYQLTRSGADDSGALGDLDVTGELAIVGDGAATTRIDGGLVDRIFHVLDGGDLELRDVTLHRGRAAGNGGALLVLGNATLLRSVVSGSQATGAAPNGYGGGAYVAEGATLSVADSTLTGNTASSGGGGIAVDGDLDLGNSTLYANVASSGSGGGLYVFTQTLVSLNNATVAHNTASGSGGGLFAESSAFIGLAPVVTNTIVAANQAPTNPDCSGSLDSGHDLIGIGTGCNGVSAANGDRVGTAAAPVDALLGALEPAGPTPVALPAAGSPAIDAGDPSAPGSGERSCESTDQRGATRPGGPRCDIGAVELTTACVPGGGVLCLQDGRFRVTARYAASPGTGSPAGGVAMTADSGYFYFVDPANVEVTVKVLDGCAINDRIWFFAAGMTTLRVDLTVTDTETGVTKTYTNPLNRRFRTIADTAAFAACP